MYLQNLKFLYLENNKIENIQSLSSLKNLISLRLNGNIIGDVSPLAQLDNLQYLHLDSRNIESGSWLKKHLPNCEIYFLELPDEIPF